MNIKTSVNIMEEAKDLVINQVINSNFKTQDWASIKANVRKVLQNYFFKKFKRRPLTIPIIIETN